MIAELRAIHNESEYDRALDEVSRLMDASRGSSEEARLETLAILVSEYESRHHPIPPPDPIDYVTHILEARGLDERDLEPYIGGPDRVSEILGRRRPLTLQMVRKLHAGLGLSPSVLIQPYRLARDRAARTRFPARETSQAGT